MCTKVCTKCHTEKDLSDFPNDYRRSDGKRSDCKTCRAKQDKLYKQNNREKVKARLHEYYIENKDKFFESAKIWRGKYPDKVKQYNKTSRQRNPIPSRIAVAKWTKLNPNYRRTWTEQNRHKGIEYAEKRRALKAGADGTITGESFIELCSLYGNKCLRCGRGDVKLTLDHIVPLSIGGTHTIENAQPLCKSCNSKKFQSVIDYRPVIWEQL